MKRKITIAVAVMAALMALPAIASATVVVQNTNDLGPGSLRATIAAAPPGETVQLPAGTYSVTSNEITIDKTLVIQGSDARTTTLGADGNNRLFSIDPPAGAVTISDVTLTGGGGAGSGGAIRNTRDLTLQRVAVVDNHASLVGNYGGGGIDSFGIDSKLTLIQSLIANNTAYTGAAISHSESLTIIDSTVTGNVSGDSTHNGQSAISGSAGSSAALLGSTIAGNSGFNGLTSGAGISESTLSASGSIIAQNLSYMPNGQPAGSTGNPGVADDCADVANFASTSTYSIDGAATCDFTGMGDLQNTDPMLGALASNGGPTNTLALLPGSPAIDHMPPPCATSVDQRGISRPQAGGCDIGAFELEAPSNAFTFGKLKRNRKRGTAVQRVTVPGPGTLDLGGSGVAKGSRGVVSAGVVKVKIKARAKAKAKLNSKGGVKLRASFTFTPTGGEPLTQVKTIKLKKKLG